MESSVPGRVTRFRAAWRKCMTRTMRPASTIVFISLQETNTIGYYERAGLVRPTTRAENQYRLYAEQTLQVIRFIRAAQAAGFTLDDVRTLLALHSGDLALCKDVQPLIAKRLAEVSQRLKEMRRIQRLLQSFL